MNRFKLLCISGILLSLLSCTSDDDKILDTKLDIQLTRSEAQVGNNTNSFSLNLLNAADDIYGKEKPNYVISPLSASWVLSMLSNGAADNSETSDEITNALNIDGSTTVEDLNEFNRKLISGLSTRVTGADIMIANAFHYKKEIGIYDSFKRTLTDYYNATEFVDPTNMTLDKWIAEKTGGKITGYANEKDLASYLVGIFNTLDFNGKWEEPFKASHGGKREFFNADGSISRPIFLDGLMKGGSYLPTDDFDFLKVHFKGKSYSIQFIVDSKGIGLDNIVEKLDLDKWQEIHDTAVEATLALELPKLHLKNRLNLIPVMEAMGIKKAFSHSAEFDKLCEYGIGIDLFEQCNVFDLDEEGVKAVTLTVGEGVGLAQIVVPKEYAIDHPFLFFITEESTGTILLAGKISHM